MSLTDITVILDASGSMSSIKASTIEGFNDFLEDQREEDGDTEITLIQFDSEIEELWSGRPLNEAFELDEGHYVTSGSTALNDAVGTGIQEAKARKARNGGDRQILYVVITDGKENASQEFSHSDIQDMIESEREEDREFIFLAANQDAMETASSYGMDPSKSMTYAHNDEGNEAAYSATSRVVSAARDGDTTNASFSADERQEQQDAAAEESVTYGTSFQGVDVFSTPSEFDSLTEEEGETINRVFTEYVRGDISKETARQKIKEVDESFLDPLK